MAKGGCTLFCLVLLLSALVDCALGQNAAGSIHLFNGADYDINFSKEVVFVNGSTNVDPVFTPVPKGRTWNMTVLDNVEVVNTLFTMTTNAPIPSRQVLVEWSTIPGAVKVPCTDCWWVVDNQGFSVGASQYQRTFVAGWE